MITTFKTLQTWIVARTAKTDRGATMVEYAIMVGLIAVVVLAVVALLGIAINQDFTKTHQCISGSGTC